MMPLQNSFNLSLAEFGEKIGAELDIVNGRCNFVVDNAIEIEIDYIEEAHVVVAWTTIGLAPEDTYQGDRARALFELNELDAQNGGFSISIDPETRRVIAHDHRPAELFDSGDRVAAWIEVLVDLVNHVRNDFAERFPCEDEPLSIDEEEA